MDSGKAGDDCVNSGLRCGLNGKKLRPSCARGSVVIIRVSGGSWREGEGEEAISSQAKGMDDCATKEVAKLALGFNAATTTAKVIRLRRNKCSLRTALRGRRSWWELGRAVIYLGFDKNGMTVHTPSLSSENPVLFWSVQPRGRRRLARRAWEVREYQ